MMMMSPEETEAYWAMALEDEDMGDGITAVDGVINAADLSDGEQADLLALMTGQTVEVDYPEEQE